MQPALAQYLAQIENPYLSQNVLELSPIGFANRIIPYIINIGLVIGVTAFILFLILGGINWITSSGDRAKLELARDKITQALTGLVVLFSFFALVQLLNLGLGVDIGNLGTGPIYSPPSPPTTYPVPSLPPLPTPTPIMNIGPEVCDPGQTFTYEIPCYVRRTGIHMSNFDISDYSGSDIGKAFFQGRASELPNLGFLFGGAVSESCTDVTFYYESIAVSPLYMFNHYIPSGEQVRYYADETDNIMTIDNRHEVEFGPDANLYLCINPTPEPRWGNYYQAISCMETGTERTRGYFRFVPTGDDNRPIWAQASSWSGPYWDYNINLGGFVCNRLVGRAETILSPFLNMEHGAMYQAISCENRSMDDEFCPGQVHSVGYYRYIPLFADGNINWGNATSWSGPYSACGLGFADNTTCIYEAGRSNVTLSDMGPNGNLLQSISCINPATGISRTYRRYVPLREDGSIYWAAATHWSYADWGSSDSQLYFPADNAYCNTIGDMDVAYIPGYTESGDGYYFERDPNILESVSCVNNNGSTRGYLRYVPVNRNTGEPVWANAGGWSGPYNESQLYFPPDNSYCITVEGRGATVIRPN